MNHALLLSGQPIFYSECYNSLVNLPKINDSKRFSYIWWDKSYKNGRNKMHFTSTYPDKEDLDLDFCDKYSIDIHETHPHRKFDISFMKTFNYDTWGNQSVKYYRMMTAIITYCLQNQTSAAYETYKLSQSGNFDIVIKSRPDVIYTKPLIHILNSLCYDDNNIYFQSSMGGGHLYAGEHANRPCDWFCVGNNVAMGKFLHDWYNLIESVYVNGMIHTNEYVKLICVKNNLNLHLIDFGTFIYKQTNDFYQKYLIKPEFYIDNYNENKCYPDNPELWPHFIDQVNFEHFKDIK